MSSALNFIEVVVCPCITYYLAITRGVYLLIIMIEIFIIYWITDIFTSNQGKITIQTDADDDDNSTLMSGHLNQVVYSFASLLNISWWIIVGGTNIIFMFHSIM